MTDGLHDGHIPLHGENDDATGKIDERNDDARYGISFDKLGGTIMEP